MKLPFPKRRAVAPALAAAVTAVLLSCSSGEPFDPSPSPSSDPNTYVLASVTLLDEGLPCLDDPAPCDAEFFDCSDQTPKFVGETWSIQGDVATAGIIIPENLLDPGLRLPVAITATDLTSLVGIALEFQIYDQFDAGADTRLAGIPGNPCVDLPTDAVNGVFVDVDPLCFRLNNVQVSEMRFEFDPCEPNSITLTDWEENSGGTVQPALDATGNEFFPTGIMEGTFSFVARNRQTVAEQPIIAAVQVEGCFRVNVPAIYESGVPVNPEPPSPACQP